MRRKKIVTHTKKVRGRGINPPKPLIIRCENEPGPEPKGQYGGQKKGVVRMLNLVRLKHESKEVVDGVRQVLVNRIDAGFELVEERLKHALSMVQEIRQSDEPHFTKVMRITAVIDWATSNMELAELLINQCDLSLVEATLIGKE